MSQKVHIVKYNFMIFYLLNFTDSLWNLSLFGWTQHRHSHRNWRKTKRSSSSCFFFLLLVFHHNQTHYQTLEYGQYKNKTRAQTPTSDNATSRTLCLVKDFLLSLTTKWLIASFTWAPTTNAPQICFSLIRAVTPPQIFLCVQSRSQEEGHSHVDVSFWKHLHYTISIQMRCVHK